MTLRTRSQLLLWLAATVGIWIEPAWKYLTAPDSTEETPREDRSL